MVSFEQSVDAIVQHRRANPSLVSRFKLATDYNSVANELEAFTAARLGLPVGVPDPKAQARPSASFDGRAAVAGSNQPPAWFRQIRTGTKTLADWLGHSGIPVPQAQAEQRAAICADCPVNQKGDWTALFTKPAANLIRRQLEERKQLNLSTPHDDKLGVCMACGCPLRLKAHVPLRYILEHQPADVEAKLDPRCWIQKEKFSAQ